MTYLITVRGKRKDQSRSGRHDCETFFGRDSEGGTVLTTVGAGTTVPLGVVDESRDTYFSVSAGVVTYNGPPCRLEFHYGVTSAPTELGEWQAAGWLNQNGTEVIGSRRYAGENVEEDEEPPAGTSVVTITSDTTLTTANDVVLASAALASITVTLPAASAETGKKFNIKKIDSSSNTVTIDANASELIDGALTAVLTDQYEAITVVSDGSNWHIL